MSRLISSAARTALYAQQTNQVFLAILRIDYDGNPAHYINVVNNMTNITSGGTVYTAYPFMIDLPGEEEDKVPEARLVIDNIDRSIIAVLRTITTPPTITISIILASTPNTVEMGPFAFLLKNIRYDAHTISGTLYYEDILNIKVPADRFTPNKFPGLF